MSTFHARASRAALVLGAALLLPAILSATQRDVPDDYDSIQEAIDASASGDEILIAAGIYYENLLIDGKSLSLTGVDGAEVTIIDGSEETRGEDYASVIEIPDNAGEVLLEGLTLTNGSGRIASNQYGQFMAGGGVYCVRGELKLQACSVTENEFSGVFCQFSALSLANCSNSRNNGMGVLCLDSALSIVECRFESNTDSGVYCWGGSILAEQSRFEKNSSMNGGGMELLDLESCSILECSFLANTSGTFGGGVDLVANMYTYDLEPQVEILDCQFVENTASFVGGGLTCLNGSSGGVLTLGDTFFADNVSSAFVGGGATVDFGDNFIDSCAFTGNGAPRGGGLYLFHSDARTIVTQCLFATNSASDFGAALVVDTYLMHQPPESVWLDSCTFVANGGGASSEQIVSLLTNSDIGGVPEAEYDVDVTNCILSVDPGTSFLTYESEVDVSIGYSLISGGWDGDGNIDADPLFVDAAGGDYRLQRDSPCIDSGDPDSALDPDGTRADMGAFPYEQNGFLRGDVNGNGTVLGLLDGIALLRWGFSDGDVPVCLDAADADDNGALSPLIDALVIFRWGYAGGDPPPYPGPTSCGTDHTADTLDCAAMISCD